MKNDLIDRYLAAIGRELPPAKRTDIVAELRDELMSGLEAREQQLGRRLSHAEQSALLVDFGNPLLVAGRYRTVQHLIGPALYPVWWAALRASLVVIAVVYGALILIGLMGGRLSVDGVVSPLSAAVFMTGAVTLVFALMERFGDPAKITRWRPERLPPARGKRRSRFDLTTELVMGVVFLLWWIGVIHFRDQGAAFDTRVELGPVWDRWHWWIVGYALVEIGSNLVALARPDRAQLVRWLTIWRSLLGAGILLGVIQASHFLVVTGPSGKAQAFLDGGMRLVLGALILGFVARAATEAWRLRHDPDAPSSAEVGEPSPPAARR